MIINRAEFLRAYYKVSRFKTLDNIEVLKEVEKQLAENGSDEYELSSYETTSKRPELFTFKRVGNDLKYIK